MFEAQIPPQILFDTLKANGLAPAYGGLKTILQDLYKRDPDQCIKLRNATILLLNHPTFIVTNSHKYGQSPDKLRKDYNFQLQCLNEIIPECDLIGDIDGNV